MISIKSAGDAGPSRGARKNGYKLVFLTKGKLKQVISTDIPVARKDYFKTSALPRHDYSLAIQPKHIFTEDLWFVMMGDRIVAGTRSL